MVDSGAGTDSTVRTVERKRREGVGFLKYIVFISNFAHCNFPTEDQYRDQGCILL
jgi:hypothetical protein